MNKRRNKKSKINLKKNKSASSQIMVKEIKLKKIILTYIIFYF